MATQDVPKIKRVTEEELRNIFNEKYLPRIQKGELLEKIMRGAERHPSLAPAHEPYCTRSQKVHYFDPVTKGEVARCHRYLRPDGTIGASGKPDPKRVFADGVVYRIVKGKNRKT